MAKLSTTTKLPSKQLVPVRPENPTDLGFPPGLATELAMGLSSVREICDAYEVTRDDLEALVENPIFKAEYDAALATRQKEGGLFTLKARLMADQALDVQYKLMNDTDVPPAVRLKASENIVGAADRMPKPGTKADAPTFAIQINL